MLAESSQKYVSIIKSEITQTFFLNIFFISHFVSGTIRTTINEIMIGLFRIEYILSIYEEHKCCFVSSIEHQSVPMIHELTNLEINLAHKTAPENPKTFFTNLQSFRKLVSSSIDALMSHFQDLKSERGYYQANIYGHIPNRI